MTLLSPREGKAPALGFRPRSSRTRTWWRGVWSSPVASAWIDADVLAVRDLAMLRDRFNVAVDESDLESMARLRPAIDRLEDRLGLTPRARRVLGWVLAGEGEADNEEGPPAVPDDLAAAREARWARIAARREGDT